MKYVDKQYVKRTGMQAFLWRFLLIILLVLGVSSCVHRAEEIDAIAAVPSAPEVSMTVSIVDSGADLSSTASGQTTVPTPLGGIVLSVSPLDSGAVINEPVATELVATEPVATEPVATEPVTTEPVTTEPVTTEPVATEPVTTEPVATEPVATEPVATEPVATEPVATVSVATEPVTTEPMGAGINAGSKGMQISDDGSGQPVIGAQPRRRESVLQTTTEQPIVETQSTQDQEKSSGFSFGSKEYPMIIIKVSQFFGL